MIKYIVYCLDIKTFSIEIITIEDDEKEAKNVQNNHSFTLLCELNKKQSLYKLELKNNIIQIIEININIQNGWIGDKVKEVKNPILEIGIISYNCKKEFSLTIKESYILPNISNIQNKAINTINQQPKEKIQEQTKYIWKDVLSELNKRIKKE